MRSLETKGKKALDSVEEIKIRDKGQSDPKMTVEEISKMIRGEFDSQSNEQAIFDEVEAGKATILEVDSETIDKVEKEIGETQQKIDSLVDRAKAIRKRGGDGNDR